MAQSGRAPAWGVGGRRFESDHPDQKINRAVNASVETNVDSSFVLNSGVDLNEVLTSFLGFLFYGFDLAFDLILFVFKDTHLYSQAQI